MNGTHIDTPRIPGRPLGCCKQCRYNVRWPVARPGICPRCGLPRSGMLKGMKKITAFVDRAGNIFWRSNHTSCMVKNRGFDFRQFCDILDSEGNNP